MPNKKQQLQQQQQRDARAGSAERAFLPARDMAAGYRRSLHQVELALAVYVDAPSDAPNSIPSESLPWAPLPVCALLTAQRGSIPGQAAATAAAAMTGESAALAAASAAARFYLVLWRVPWLQPRRHLAATGVLWCPTSAG